MEPVLSPMRLYRVVILFIFQLQILELEQHIKHICNLLDL